MTTVLVILNELLAAEMPTLVIKEISTILVETTLCTIEAVTQDHIAMEVKTEELKAEV